MKADIVTTNPSIADEQLLEMYISLELEKHPVQLQILKQMLSQVAEIQKLEYYAAPVEPGQMGVGSALLLLILFKGKTAIREISACFQVFLKTNGGKIKIKKGDLEIDIESSDRSFIEKILRDFYNSVADSHDPE